MGGSKEASTRKWYLNQDPKDTRNLSGEFAGWRIDSKRMQSPLMSKGLAS